MQMLAVWQVRQLAMLQAMQVLLKSELPVRQVPQTLLEVQDWQFATAHERGWQVLLLSAKEELQI